MTMRNVTGAGYWLAASVVALMSAGACAGDSNGNDPTSTSSSSSSSSNGGNTSANGGSTTTANGGSDGGGGNAGGNEGGGGNAGGGNSGDVVRLIAIGDTGEGNDDQHCLAWAMSSKCQQDGCDAVLLAGDNFYNSSGINSGGVDDENDPQWMEKFELPYDRPGLSGLPFYAVLGNHDYAPPPLTFVSGGSAEAQVAYGSLPIGDGTMDGFRHSDKWTMPDKYYDVQLGNGMVHLFAMDSQDASNTQLNDMSQRAAASTATWNLLFMHFPRYTSGDHQSDMDFLNLLLGTSGPDLYEMQRAVYCHTDIFLSGHDHDREHITAGQDPSCPNTHFLVSGAGAKVNSDSGSPLSNQAYFNKQIEGFFYLIFEDDKITIESYDKTTQANTREENDCAPAGLAPPAYSATILK